MDCLPSDPVLEFRPGVLQAVRRAYGLENRERMEEAIDSLDNWVKKQRHFRKTDFPRSYLERVIIFKKGSVERAKSTMDKACTFRTLLPQFFGDFDARTDFKSIETKYCMALLPQQTEEYGRVAIMRRLEDRIESTDILHVFQFANLTVEYVKAHDYTSSFTVILDYMDVSISEIIQKINFADLRNGVSILLDGFGARVKGVHIMTKVKVFDIIIRIAKSVLSAKISERLHVHNSVEELYEFVPREMLPVEYGGKERPLKELKERLVEVLSSAESRQFAREMNKAYTDEAYRNAEVFNEQYLGMAGTFKKLTVD